MFLYFQKGVSMFNLISVAYDHYKSQLIIPVKDEKRPTSSNKLLLVNNDLIEFQINPKT